MKLAIIAGPPTTGKTTVLRRIVKKFVDKGQKVAYVKIDVQFADEDEIFAKEFGIPTKKAYSGELCPDHCNVMVLGDAIDWGNELKADVLFVETAGLCLRCSPYVDKGLGMVILEATSGANLPHKVGPMLTLADTVVVTKIDLVSQAEREVFRAHIMEASPSTRVIETNALYGIGIDPLIALIENSGDVSYPLQLRGNPPVGTCTICVGKKDIGWKQHFGVVRPLNSDLFYQGE
ncbi:Urease accessory protein UreG [uncultured archaeon]|nr:Urease accessory protein UreG [uncultured archaeon]